MKSSVTSVTAVTEWGYQQIIVTMISWRRHSAITASDAFGMELSGLLFVPVYHTVPYIWGGSLSKNAEVPKPRFFRGISTLYRYTGTNQSFWVFIFASPTVTMSRHVMGLNGPVVAAKTRRAKGKGKQNTIKSIEKNVNIFHGEVVFYDI